MKTSTKTTMRTILLATCVLSSALLAGCKSKEAAEPGPATAAVAPMVAPSTQAPEPPQPPPAPVIDVEGACSQVVKIMADAHEAMQDYSLNKTKLRADCTAAMNQAPENERQAAVACFKSAADFSQGADCFKANPTIKF